MGDQGPGKEIAEGEDPLQDRKGVSHSDLVWLWASYIVSIISVLCSCLTQSQLAWTLSIGSHFELTLPQLAACVWLCTALGFRLAWILEPCDGMGIQSLVQAVQTLAFASMLFAYCNIRPEELLDGLTVSSICIISSWTLMVATLKNGGNLDSLVPHVGGWLIRHVRQSAAADALLFGLPDVHLLVKVLQYTSGGSALFLVPPRALTPLWVAYYGRAIYGLIELVTCLYSISRLDARKETASDR